MNTQERAMPLPRASIIISTWNGRHLLETCLPRVLAAVQQAGGDHEVIVVDDASSDDTVAFVSREFPQVRLLALPRNLRFAGANNAAARLARGEFLVFLNNDMLVEPDFLEPLLRPFRDPAVFAVTAHIHMPPKRVGGREVKETGLVRARFEQGFFVLRHEEPPPHADGRAIPVMYAGGGSSAWRRDQFFQLGAFDRLFRPFYFEDLDVSYRAQKAGWRVVFAPDSHVLHQHRQTNNPANFPAGYVERMFGKNSLLFTWKVLTDEALIAQHFLHLWRLLMQPRQHPELASWFLRAARQLPELLVKRHCARKDYVLSDSQVLALQQQEPAGLEAEEESATAGRRILVIGPGEGGRAARTSQIARVLAEAGHRVAVLAYARTRPEVQPTASAGIVWHSAHRSELEAGAVVTSVCARVRPDGIVATDAFSAWAACRVSPGTPLWADLEVYAGGEGEDDSRWEWECAALARADAFSVVSRAHRDALVGELSAIGRSPDDRAPRIFCLPPAVDPTPPRHTRRVLLGTYVEETDFLLLWCGASHRAADIETLLAGVTAAMREDSRLRLVCLRGAWDDLPARAWIELRQMAEGSDLAERFVFIEGVGSAELPNYCFESHAGITTERATAAARLSEPPELVEMMRTGLPIISTHGNDLSQVIRAERLGLTCAPGNAEELKDAILTFARDESLRRRCGERARQWVAQHRDAPAVFAPLCRWASDPVPALDQDKARRLPGRGWEPRGRLSRFLQVWETRGPRSALQALLRGGLRLTADALFRAFVWRRPSPSWGLDPKEPPSSALVIRAGSASLVRQVVARLRERYPTVNVAALAPEPLADETRYEADVPVTAAPGVGLVSYRITRRLLRELHRGNYDTVVVAGEGNRRAELVALLAGFARRVEVREDGAAHTFSLAPYKPLWLLARGIVGVVERLTLTTCVGLVWGAIWLEGKIWRFREIWGFLPAAGRKAPEAG